MSKICPRCKDEFDGRTKFCCNSCKYWFNSIKKDNEKHLPPARKRTREYFHMLVGSKRASGRGQGKRVNGTIKGSMSAMVMVAVEEIVPVTKENLQRHFKGIPGNTPVAIRLGDGSYVRKENILNELKINL